MNLPLVSVIIAVSNGERYLAAAIRSVLEQNYDPLEVILIDGNSRDKTAEIAQSFAEVRYVPQLNRGVANAYNQGIELATGELIAFISHDDLWTPDKLRVQVSHMRDHPHLQYTTAKIRFFLEPGCAVPPGFRPELLQGEHNGHIMETLVARQSLFEVVGRFNPHLSTAEDVDWFARARDYLIPTATIPKVLLSKRVHNTNLSLNSLANNRNLLSAVRQSIARKEKSS